MVHTDFSCKDGGVHTALSIKLVRCTQIFLTKMVGANRFFYKIGVLHTDFSYKDGVLHTDFLTMMVWCTQIFLAKMVGCTQLCL